jgi:hypothetical protein
MDWVNWNGIIIGAGGDVPPPVINSKKTVTSHGNKCQLDAFAEGPPAIDFLATAFPAPASVLVHLSRRGFPMAPRRRERYLRPYGSTVAVKGPELARNTVAGSTVERCEVWVTSEALGLESRVEIRATKVQRGPRRAVPLNKPAAEAVAAQRLKSHDHISGVVASLGSSTERETNLTNVLRKVNSSSVTRIDDIEAGPRCQGTREDWRDPHKRAHSVQRPWYMRGTGGPILGRANGYVDPTKREKV